MRVRLGIIGLFALLEIFMLLGVAASETSSPDFDAYMVGQNETLQLHCGGPMGFRRTILRNSII